MKKKLAGVAAAMTIAIPVGNAIAASKATLAAVTPKKKVVTLTKTVSGQAYEADRWGPLQVTLVVKKTTTTVGTKKTVTRKITAGHLPGAPNHTAPAAVTNQPAPPI